MSVWSIINSNGTLMWRRYLARWRLRDNLVVVDSQDNLAVRILRLWGQARKLTCHSVEGRLQMPTDNEIVVI
jgi:hypothetical protein